MQPDPVSASYDYVVVGGAQAGERLVDVGGRRVEDLLHGIDPRLLRAGQAISGFIAALMSTFC